LLIDRVKYIILLLFFHCFFFLQAEDGIRDFHVTGVQTCALPISCGLFYHSLSVPLFFGKEGLNTSNSLTSKCNFMRFTQLTSCFRHTKTELVKLLLIKQSCQLFYRLFT